MQKQVITDTAAPWSLLAVTLITFLLPAGGAVVAVRNLTRLDDIEPRRAMELTVATILVFAAGYAALLSVVQSTSGDAETMSPVVTLLLSFGTAAAAFFFQRENFSAWRESHPSGGTSPWYSALGWALVFHILTGVAAIPFFLVIAVIASAGA